MAALKRNAVKTFWNGVGLSDDQFQYQARHCDDADPMANYVALDLVYPGFRPFDALALVHRI